MKFLLLLKNENPQIRFFSTEAKNRTQKTERLCFPPDQNLQK